MAVRNSLLEELGTSYSSLLPAPSTTPLMDDRDARRITEAAIRYWSRLAAPGDGLVTDEFALQRR